jgi:hypothetical protein
MDVKRTFSSDSVVTIQGISRDLAITRQHGPLYVRKYKNLHRDVRRKPPDGQEHPPPEDEDQRQTESRSEKEGFEITV